MQNNKTVVAAAPAVALGDIQDAVVAAATTPVPNSIVCWYVFCLFCSFGIAASEGNHS